MSLLDANDCLDIVGLPLAMPLIHFRRPHLIRLISSSQARGHVYAVGEQPVFGHETHRCFIGARLRTPIDYLLALVAGTELCSSSSSSWS
ncbi:unnamed protein product [Haemonchus placei]|uniref:Transcriptional regulator n=1 Tax=Haemonchus placei TaxID=6290 RepID=A0A0N4WJL4_HAEPC|nr:unnamed protein product [Haemonchus placei]